MAELGAAFRSQYLRIRKNVYFFQLDQYFTARKLFPDSFNKLTENQINKVKQEVIMDYKIKLIAEKKKLKKMLTQLSMNKIASSPKR